MAKRLLKTSFDGPQRFLISLCSFDCANFGLPSWCVGNVQTSLKRLQLLPSLSPCLRHSSLSSFSFSQYHSNWFNLSIAIHFCRFVLKLLWSNHMAPPTTPPDSAVTQGYTNDDVTAAAALVGLAFPFVAPPAFYNPNAWAQQGPNAAQALLDAQIPDGTERIPTLATGHLCGLYAIRNGVEAANFGITVPTVAELEEVARSPEVNVNRTSNFYESELARLLHRWGSIRGLNLHMGFLQYNGPPTLSGLEGSDADNAQVFWIYNDNAAPEGSLNPLGVLNHWSGVQRRSSIQADDSPDELAPDNTPHWSTSGRSSPSQLTSSQSSFSQSSSSESSSASSSASQSQSGRSTTAAPAGIPSTHSADHTDSSQQITAQPAPSSPAVSTQALSQHSSPLATHSPPARSPETNPLEIEPASVQAEATTEPRRSNRVAKVAKAEQQPLDAQKLCPPHEHRYLCPIDGCKGSANSLADLNRYHRGKDHATLEKFEEAKTVDWLEWLAGRKCTSECGLTKLTKCRDNRRCASRH